ncbi:MAG: arginine--tRNA ligase [Holosporales bacterium]|nr:arginine--tRNA ligase [Holosporales bacterium]
METQDVFCAFEALVKKSFLEVMKNCDKTVIEPTVLNDSAIKVETPKDQKFGDMSSNVAMVFAKTAGINPRKLAEDIAEVLQRDDRIANVNVAGPGFINWALSPSYVQKCLAEVISIPGERFGLHDLGQGQKVNIEYVSANPTGPLHAGHARGAVVGDVLANLLSAVGYYVTKEYYINDAGNQIDVLARSVYHRYCERLGRSMGPLPDNCYPGEYVSDIAQKLIKLHGNKFLDQSEQEWLPLFKQFSVQDQMTIIKQDLAELGVHHDVFVSEASLIEKGLVGETLEYLKSKGLVYQGVLNPPKGKMVDDWEPREQTLFKSTAFGDEIDRPLLKSDGSWTYFASDIAYHRDKLERGHDILINFWGADHGGYVKRMEAAVDALSDKKLTVKICQLVKFVRDGKDVKMSKRAGVFITMRDVLDAVGRDVTRFIMLTRRDDMALDFDFAQVVEKSRDNPVFYVQYAHARICSVFRQYRESFGRDFSADIAKSADLSQLNSEEELTQIKLLLQWPRALNTAALALEPHKIVFFLQEVAAGLHALWNAGKNDLTLRFVNTDNEAETASRLALLYATKMVISSGFKIVGIDPVEELR